MQIAKSLRLKIRSRQKKGKGQDGRTQQQSSQSDVASAAPSMADSTSQAAATGTVVRPSGTPPQTAEPGSEQDTAHSPSQSADQMWDKAYDRARDDERELVGCYEKILSLELGDPAADPKPIPTNATARRQHMDRLLDAGLKRTERFAKANEDINNVLEIILSVKGAVGDALKPVPVAAVAWAGITVALDVFSTQAKESKSNRDGITQVVEKMKWYSSLSRLLLDQDKDTENLTGLRHRLADKIIDLYKAILIYIMKSVCAYNQNQVLNALRNMLRLDKWSGTLGAVTEAEAAVNEAASKIGKREVNSYLKILVSIHRSEAQNGLLKMCCVADMRAEIEFIESRTDKLVAASYRWILGTREYRNFTDWERTDANGRLLWIKGNAGKGKTMLCIGVVRDLTSRLETRFDMHDTGLSYFFCQASNGNLNTAAAIVKGLIWMLVRQEHSLIAHLENKFWGQDAERLRDDNAFFTLRPVLQLMLQDKALKRAYLIVDALDECVTDLRPLLEMISQFSAAYPNVRWLVSSRNEPDVEAGLATHAPGETRLSLELNADSVASAVEAYINHKMKELSDKYRQKRYLKRQHEKLHETEREISRVIGERAGGTFLWVALVFREIEGCQAADALARVTSIPQGLNMLYRHMLDRVTTSKDIAHLDRCRNVLLVMASCYRPLHIDELFSLAAPGLVSPEELIRDCGLLAIDDNDAVSFIHQSAREFLEQDAELGDGTHPTLFPDGLSAGHFIITSASLRDMSECLRRDIYDLRDFGCSIDDITHPNPDPLAHLRYSCVFWIYHFCEVLNGGNSFNCSTLGADVPAVSRFLESHLLHWLESLSLLRALPEAIISIKRLLRLIQPTANLQLAKYLQDIERFAAGFSSTIERLPLQLYASALVFCPNNTEIKRLHWGERWDIIDSVIHSKDYWDPSRQTLVGHTYSVLWIAISPDGKTVASASSDRTVRLWDADSGTCQKILEGHTRGVSAVAFLPNSRNVASASLGGHARIWDTYLGTCQETSIIHGEDNLVTTFSPDGKTIATTTCGRLVIWLWDTGPAATCRHILRGHSHIISAIAFSPDSGTVASACWGGTVRIWDTNSGVYLRSFFHRLDWFSALAYSPDGGTIATGSWGKVRLWDVDSGTLLRTFECHDGAANGVAFSPDGNTLAVGNENSTVELWDTNTGACQQKLEGHTSSVRSIAFSPDGQTLASASQDATVRIWDITLGHHYQALEDQGSPVIAAASSPDSKTVVTLSSDMTVRIWDVALGTCKQASQDDIDIDIQENMVVTFPHVKTIALAAADGTVWLWYATPGVYLHTLRGHKSRVRGVAFSPDGKLIATASEDRTVRLWDATSGAWRQTLEIGSQVRTVAFSPNNMMVVSACFDGVNMLWNADSDTYSRLPSSYKPRSGDDGDDGDDCDDSDDSDDSVDDGNDSDSSEDVGVVRGAGRVRGVGGADVVDGDGTVGAITFSPDGKTIAARLSNGTIELWDVASCTSKQRLKCPGFGVGPVIFSPDGKKVASAFGHGPIRLWDTDSGTCQEVSYNYRTSHLCFSNDGRYVITDRGKLSISSAAGETSEECIFITDEWVTRGGKNLLWLPYNYRAKKAAVHDDWIALVHVSGEVTILTLR